MIVDTWKRLVVKTISWRFIAFVTLALIAFFTTGSMALAGSIALIDTVVKSVIYLGHELTWNKINWGRKLKEKKGCVVWFTGLSGSGKTTVADAVAEKLRKRLISVSRLDGDVARRTFSSDLGFSKEDRAENCKRAAHVSSYLKESSIVLASFISPTVKIRMKVESMIGRDFLQVHVDCPVEQCAKRDPKGMYSQLKDGKFKGNPFTGMHPDAPYESPYSPDLVLHTVWQTVEGSAQRVIDMLTERGYL